MRASVHKAVIMARGLGTRMRSDDRATTLNAEQSEVASRGVKALMPLGGARRPFLDFVISGLADAGFEDVCLVIGSEHDALRQRYTVDVRPARVRLAFAVQAAPRGTADAVLAARGFAGGDLFAVVNSDNYYPVDVLRALREMGRPGLAGFERQALVEQGNIEPDRVTRFALLDVDAAGILRAIVEKPDAATIAAMGRDALVSMNCWLFGPPIFDACAATRPSARGELELADAVQRAIASGARFTVLRVARPVLDLTSRADVAEVAERLQRVSVRL